MKIFSRSGRESTFERFSLVPYVVSVTADVFVIAERRCRRIEQALKAATGACVLDGELLTFNEHTQQVEAFGLVQLMAPHRDSRVHAGRHLMCVLFDAMCVDGASIAHLPLSARRARLQAAVTPIAQHVHLSDGVVARLHAALLTAVVCSYLLLAAVGYARRCACTARDI